MAPESDHSKPIFRRINSGDHTDHSPLPGTLASFLGPSTFDLDEALSWPIVYSPTSPSEEARQPNTPAPEILVSSMPSVFGGGVCAVCMEEIGGSTCGKRMPCSHVYHLACISQWLARDTSCPLCRCQICPE